MDVNLFDEISSVDVPEIHYLPGNNTPSDSDVSILEVTEDKAMLRDRSDIGDLSNLEANAVIAMSKYGSCNTEPPNLNEVKPISNNVFDKSKGSCPNEGEVEGVSYMKASSKRLVSSLTLTDGEVSELTVTGSEMDVSARSGVVRCDAGSTEVVCPSESGAVRYDAGSTVVVCPSENGVVRCDGDSTEVVCPSESGAVRYDAGSTVVVCPSESGAVRYDAGSTVVVCPSETGAVRYDADSTEVVCPLETGVVRYDAGSTEVEVPAESGLVISATDFVENDISRSSMISSQSLIDQSIACERPEVGKTSSQNIGHGGTLKIENSLVIVHSGLSETVDSISYPSNHEKPEDRSAHQRESQIDQILGSETYENSWDTAINACAVLLQKVEHFDDTSQNIDSWDNLSHNVELCVDPSKSLNLCTDSSQIKELCVDPSKNIEPCADPSPKLEQCYDPSWNVEPFNDLCKRIEIYNESLLNEQACGDPSKNAEPCYDHSQNIEPCHDHSQNEELCADPWKPLRASDKISKIVDICEEPSQNVEPCYDHSQNVEPCHDLTWNVKVCHDPSHKWNSFDDQEQNVDKEIEAMDRDTIDYQVQNTESSDVQTWSMESAENAGDPSRISIGQLAPPSAASLRAKKRKKQKAKLEKQLAKYVGSRDSGTGGRRKFAASFKELLPPPEDDFHSDFTCPVCLDLFHRPHIVSPCQHMFCEPCLRKLPSSALADNAVCPLCRCDIAVCTLDVDLHQQLSSYYTVLYTRRARHEKKLRTNQNPLPRVYNTPLSQQIIRQIFRSNHSQRRNSSKVLSLILGLFMSALPSVLYVWVNIPIEISVGPIRTAAVSNIWVQAIFLFGVLAWIFIGVLENFTDRNQR